MAKLFSYQIPQIISLTVETIDLNITGFAMSNYPINPSDISIFRGMSTTIQIMFRDIDSRFATIAAGLTPQVVFYDDTGTIYYQSDLSLIDVTQGLYDFVVKPTDLLSWTNGDLFYAISLRDGSNNLSPVYTDRNYTVVGDVHVIYGPLPNPPTPTTILFSSFTRSGLIYYSGGYPGPNSDINPSGIQTAAIYQSGFIGSVIVQGTLDLNYTSDNTQWFDITNYNTSSAYTGVSSISFVGNYTFIRFLIEPTFTVIPNGSGEVTQIIYQN